MDMQGYPPFIYGVKTQRVIPLNRHLPRLPYGIARQWLQTIPKGTWILDPFGSSPHLLREIAESGYRILATINNPVLRYITAFNARALPREDILRVISQLSKYRRDEERLESYISSLYLVECPTCGQETPAKEFHWLREENLISRAVIDCRYCGNAGILQQNEIILRDTFRHIPDQMLKLDYQRVLTKVAALGDPKRVVADEVLSQYGPRSIHALATLLYYTERNNLSPGDNFLFDGLFLHVFDQCSNLWPVDHPDQRLRSLQTPIEYIEHNLWEAVESFSDFGMDYESEVFVSTWPDPPPEQTGVWIFPGRLSEYFKTDNQIEIHSVLTCIPRPNQVLWNSSGVWSSLLWKDDPNIAFESMMKRRRFDWNWLTQALTSVFRNLSDLIPDTSSNLFLAPDFESKFLISITTACILNQIHLTGICINNTDHLAHIHARYSPETDATSPKNINQQIRVLVDEFLQLRGEPSSLLSILAYVIPKIQNSITLDTQSQVGITPYKELLNLVEYNISQNQWLEVTNRGSRSLDIQRFWHKAPTLSRVSITDQVELHLYRELSTKQLVSMADIANSVYNQFRGPFTPDSAVINNCIYAYAKPASGDRLLGITDWEFQSLTETGEETISQILSDIAKQLGYSIQNEKRPHSDQMVWIDAGAPVYEYFLLTHAIFSDLKQYASELNNRYLVYPNQLSELIGFKLRNNPPLSKYILMNFKIINYSQIRNLSKTKHLTRANFPELIESILVDQSDKQFSLF